MLPRAASSRRASRGAADLARACGRATQDVRGQRAGPQPPARHRALGSPSPAARARARARDPGTGHGPRTWMGLFASQGPCCLLAFSRLPPWPGSRNALVSEEVHTGVLVARGHSSWMAKSMPVLALSVKIAGLNCRAHFGCSKGLPSLARRAMHAITPLLPAGGVLSR